MKLKRIFAAVTAFALCASLAGCGAAATVSESAAESAVEATPAVTEAPATEETADASETALRIAGLKGPTTMGLVNLMSDEVASNYNFTMYGAADEIVPLLVKGDLDAAAVPANLAATLYNKTNGAVEVAKKRAVMENALLLFASATPLTETYHAAESGKLQLVQLAHR